MVMKRELFCIFYSNFANPLIELGLYLLEMECTVIWPDTGFLVRFQAGAPDIRLKL